MSRNGYDFYLGKCLLPITPSKLTVKINGGNTTLTLMDEGQINILRRPELTEIDFECRIPQTKYPFAKYKKKFLKASYYLGYFQKLKTRRGPFQFIVSRVKPRGGVFFSTNMKVSLEDYTITEQAKEGFDLIVKIKLKQYRSYGTKTVTLKQPAPDAPPDAQPQAEVQPTRPVESKPESKSYKEGDIVNYHGGTHFFSSYPGTKGYPAKAGQARITAANGSGKAHPWHLIHTNSASNVYGWVDDGTFD